MYASFGKGVRLLNFTFLKIKFTSYRFSPSTEKPSTEKPSTEKPSTEKPSTEKPITEKPITEKPITEKPITEKPSTNNTDKSRFMRRNTQHFRRHKRFFYYIFMPYASYRRCWFRFRCCVALCCCFQVFAR